MTRKELAFDTARQQVESLLNRSDLTADDRRHIINSLIPLDVLCQHRRWLSKPGADQP